MHYGLRITDYALRITHHASRIMSDDIQISVVIPTYNRGHLIGRALESTLRQTKLPAEIIVVDDGSTDDTQERVRAFGDRVRYLYQENSGSAAARHQGIVATGGVGRFYFADTVRSSRDDRRRLWEIANFCIQGDYELLQNATPWVLRKRQPMMLQSTVFHKAAYLASGGFWQLLRYRDDTHLFLKLGIGAPVCAVNSIGCQMTDDGGDNRLSANYEQAKRGCQMQILMNEELLGRPLPLNPAERAELRSRLATAHRCVARFAWRERHFGEMVCHIIKSALAQPRQIPKLILRGARSKGKEQSEESPNHLITQSPCLVSRETSCSVEHPDG
jgi:hypothetical protein